MKFKIINKEREPLKIMETNRSLIDVMLVGGMIDAEREISEAFGYLTAQSGYAVQDLNKTSKGVDVDDELTDWQKEKLQNLIEFKKLNLDNYGLVIDIAFFCDDLDILAQRRSTTKTRLVTAYANLLNEWCIHTGKGNQL